MSTSALPVIPKVTDHDIIVYITINCQRRSMKLTTQRLLPPSLHLTFIFIHPSAYFDLFLISQALMAFESPYNSSSHSYMGLRGSTEKHVGLKTPSQVT